MKLATLGVLGLVLWTPTATANSDLFALEDGISTHDRAAVQRAKDAWHRTHGASAFRNATPTAVAPAAENRAGPIGIFLAFDGFGGVQEDRGAQRNGGINFGVRLRPIRALGFDFGVRAGFLGHRNGDEQLIGIDGSLSFDTRVYLNPWNLAQLFVVGGVRYGRFAATNSTECPSEHSPAPEEVINVSMRYYDLSAGLGTEFRVHEQLGVSLDVRALRRQRINGSARFEPDAGRNEAPGLANRLVGVSSQVSLIAYLR
ncbi:MAG: hypothetical protein AAGE52_20385 [Myxococcota bacterium]